MPMVEMARDRHAILVRQSDIQHHDIERVGQHAPIQLGRRAGAGYGESVISQSRNQDAFAQLGIVFKQGNLQGLRTWWGWTDAWDHPGIAHA